MSDRLDDLLGEVQKLALREKEAGLPPQGILLIGQSGAGKSALINTLVAALYGEYTQVRPVGKGHTGSKSLDLRRLPCCGVKREALPQHLKERFKDCLENLPTVWDFAGLGDVDTPQYRMILELLLRGFIPPQVTIKSLIKDMKDYGVDYLRTKYKVSREEWRIERIIFVQSGCVQPATNLVNCINAVRDLVDTETGALLCPAEVFVVVTRYDLVDCQSNLLNESPIPREDFNSVKNKLAALFNLEGALLHNSIQWTNYTDLNSNQNPNIDEIALQFLVKIMKHRAVDSDPKPNEPSVGLPTRIIYRAKKLADDHRDTHIQVNPVWAIIMVIVAVIVFFVLKSFLK